MSIEANQVTKTVSSQSNYRRITTIKTSLNGIGWKEEYRANLNELIHNVNTLVTHGFAFAKFIFLNEFNKDEGFDLTKYVTKAFFQEVLLTLIDRKTLEGRLSVKTRDIRQLIVPYKEEYLKLSNYKPITLTYAQQIALYEGTKMHTAYINNVALHFGNRLNMFINLISNKKEETKRMTQEMQSNGFKNEEIKSSIKTHITDVCTKIKLDISTKKYPADIPLNFLDKKSSEQLKQFIKVYPDNYKFKKDSIYYDVKANPQNHLRAFYILAKFCEERKTRTFSCFPIRKSFIPSYITIDAKILNYHILKHKDFPVNQKHDLWRKVINYECKAIKCSKTMNFEGTLETDGVGVSLIKQNFDTKRSGGSDVAKGSLKADNNEFSYVESLSKEELNNDVDKCVLIDPGRQDLLFCMHETSLPEDKKTFRFTRNQKSIETKARRFNKLQKLMKPAYVQELEANLSKISADTVSIHTYTKYIKLRSKISQPLRQYYSSEGAFWDSQNISYEQHYNEEEGQAVSTDTQSNPEYDSTKAIKKLRTYLNNLRYILQEKKTQAHLSDDKILQINTLIKEIEQYLQNSTLTYKEFESHRRTIEDASEYIKSKLPTLKYRYMRLSRKIKRQQSEKKLANNLKHKFGKDAVLVLGNWSASNMKFHEPIKGIGLRRLLRKEGFKVLLIDEFNTSSICPDCNSNLEKFKTVKNPRPYRRNAMPMVTCHGLLRCPNKNCLEIDNSTTENKRVWNRDLAAVLNFRHILFSLRETSARPDVFNRSRRDKGQKRKPSSKENKRVKKKKN